MLSTLYQEKIVTKQEMEELKPLVWPWSRLVQILCTKPPDVVKRAAKLLAEVGHYEEEEQLKGQWVYRLHLLKKNHSVLVHVGVGMILEMLSYLSFSAIYFYTVFSCTEHFFINGSLHRASRSITELSSKLCFLCADILPEQKTIVRILPEIGQYLIIMVLGRIFVHTNL